MFAFSYDEFIHGYAGQRAGRDSGMGIDIPDREKSFRRIRVLWPLQRAMVTV
jgi:hypothetical protein